MPSFLGSAGWSPYTEELEAYTNFFTPLSLAASHHVQRSADVVLLIENGHFNAPGNTSPGCLIQHVIHAVAGSAADLQILDVTLNESIARTVNEHLHVFLLSGG